MKFTVNSSQLIGAINKVIGVTPTRSTLPILGNIYISLEGKDLTIMGSDLEVYVSVIIKVDGKTDGRVALPAKKLETLLQNLPGKELSFELQSGFKTIIKTKGGRWIITGEDPNDFPMPAEVDGSRIEIESDILTKYLSKAIHAASPDELRRSMNGVFFEIKKGELRIVSTDGHRLVRIIRSSFDYDGDKMNILVPIKTCQMITRLFKASSKSGADGAETETEKDSAAGEPAKAELFFSPEFIKCNFNNISITSRLIDDTFPNYESVIPTDNEKKLRVNIDTIIGAVKRSIIMSDQVTNKTSFTVNENELKVKAANNEYGTDSEETVECTFTENEEFEIAFNGKYLLDALQHFEGEDIIFDFSTPLKAAVLNPTEQIKDENTMMLVMPVRNI